ncbi:hypothetical protein E2542_SST07749 [Spatholobus suberectus]|nr:hypothetical protein E2542_SST07749 [Spatholobus suberectus]
MTTAGNRLQRRLVPPFFLLSSFPLFFFSLFLFPFPTLCRIAPRHRRTSTSPPFAHTHHSVVGGLVMLPFVVEQTTYGSHCRFVMRDHCVAISLCVSSACDETFLVCPRRLRSGMTTTILFFPLSSSQLLPSHVRLAAIRNIDPASGE